MASNHPPFLAISRIAKRDANLVEGKINYEETPRSVALGVFAIAGAAVSRAQENPMVSAAAMYASKDIVDNAVNSAEHTTLVTAAKTAGLVDTLNGAGPFERKATREICFCSLAAPRQCREARSSRQLRRRQLVPGSW